MKHAILVLLAASSLPALAMTDAEITHMTEPPTDATNSHYVANLPPLEPSRLIPLPIASIKPAGWLEQQLRFQADGFHGHLRDISPYLKAEGNAWLDPNGVGEQGWEEVPYWLKGYMNAAYILGDQAMIEESHRWIEGAINSQQDDGWFGPGEGRTGIATDLAGREDLWPNMVMLFCLMDYHDYTGDERVIDLMTKYFRYLESVPEEKFLVGYWPKMRGGDQLAAIHWLYNRTPAPGGEWLLALADKTHRHTARWDEGVINWHNVNIAQGFREPTQWWVQSHEDADRDGAERVWQDVRDDYGQVPGGMFGADENARPGFDDPRQCVETCGIVEEMLSNEILIGITGDMTWADRCETVAFNALPAAFTADMGALRYLIAPNQPVSDGANHAPGIANGGGMFLMSPHRHRCCQHNAGHGWPYFAQHLWFATPDNGLAATLYSASAVTAKVGNDATVTIREDTAYPFDDTIRFTIVLEDTATFPLYLRVPAWCEAAEIAINGEVVDSAPPAGLVRIAREWADGDTVTLRLPMEVRVTEWPTNHGFVSVDRGPLTYSLDIGEEHRRVDDAGAEEKNIEPGRAAILNDRFPAYEILPAGDWNYGLAFDGRPVPDNITAQTRPYPKLKSPWTPETVPVVLTAEARKIPEWQLDMHGLAAPLQDSPAYSDEPVEQIRLIPMGAARVRITAFPVASSDDSANRWIPPQTPKKLYEASASHTYGGDSVLAIADGLTPSSSADHTIPRHTFWPRTGTTEWLEASLDGPREVSSVGVYWFDDSGVGRCRVPASWKLYARDGASWKPVETDDDFAVEADRFNTVRFAPLTADALRIEVQLQDEFSAGVLEWKIE